MSREVIEAMTALASEKGISHEKLMLALQDALLAAYKKQPGSAKYARVELDPETMDFRVIELIIPERLEAQLIVETIDEGTTVDPETGEMREPEDPEIDPVKFEQYRDQIDTARKGVSVNQRIGVSTDKTTAAIEHALLADRPKHRYLVGTPAKLIGTATRLLPDRLLDLATAVVGP